MNGFKITRDPKRPYDLAIRFHNATYSDSSLGGVAVPTKPLLNGACLDISKRRVEECFEDVFGYPLRVDPTQYRGKALRKSNANFRHDGTLIDCPVDASAVHPDHVYEKAVDNTTADGFILDYRVPVFGGRLPCVLMRYFPGDDRFTHKRPSHTRIVTPGEAFSETELAGLKALAARMGLDVGEMDVLRDNGDQRVYVVDVNTTPSGPHKGYAPEQKRELLGVLAAEFARLVDERLAQAAQGRGSTPRLAAPVPQSGAPRADVHSLDT